VTKVSGYAIVDGKKYSEKQFLKLNLTKATTLRVFYCDGVTEINAPNATALKVWCCYAVTKINVPNTTTLELVCCPMYAQNQKS